MTFVALANITLGSSASSVSFSSIPTTGFRDLILISFVRSFSSDSNVRARFNGDGASNYTYVRMLGLGSNPANSDSTTETGLQVGRQTNGSDIGFGSGVAQIMDYSATDKHKTVLVRADNGNALAIANAGRWSNTSAITSIVLTSFEGTANFAAGSSFALYGIRS